MPVAAHAQSDSATVRVDGRAVFQVGPSGETDDADQRARRIEQRLNGLLPNLDALAPPVARPVEVPGADHNDALLADGDLLVDAVVELAALGAGP